MPGPINSPAPPKPEAKKPYQIPRSMAWAGVAFVILGQVVFIGGAAQAKWLPRLAGLGVLAFSQWLYDITFLAGIFCFVVGLVLLAFWTIFNAIASAQK